MKIFYAISTHWDREWYKPFQGFRYDLAKVTDRVIDALESGKIKTFTFDGQTVVLEDYLEIRPQKREALKKLIKSGRLKVGPWYVMPDELLVSGESIIRNFLTGSRVAEQFDSKIWKYGYINDIFGHIAQLPQILNGFGINAVYMGRGVGAADQNFKNFIWRAPDGSECFGYKERYAALNDEFKKGGDRKDTVLKYLSDNCDNTGAVIMLYTHDHITIDDDMLEFEKIKDEISEQYEVTDGLEGISAALREKKDALPVCKGELITTAETENEFRSVTSSISSYYPLKFENDMCENLLESRIAPILAMSKFMNIDIDMEFYRLAAKYLLKNQPHDSICGCSADVVHEDMRYRYSQVRSISSAIELDFEDSISGSDESRYLISVLNYDLKKYRGVFTTDILFKRDGSDTTDNARYQEFRVFDILDSEGNSVPYQIIDIEKNYGANEKPYMPLQDRYRVAVFGELNAFGGTTFEIVPRKPKNGVKELSDGELCAEGKFIRLEIEPDGSLTIADKESGKIYRGLNTFIDDGEIGNGWFSERPAALNGMVSSKGARTTIEVLRRGEALSEFKITKTMIVPKGVDYDTMKRSEETAEMTVCTNVMLKKDSRTVELKTTVDNTARNHRLRMEFPTGIGGEDYYASQAFTFLNRRRGVTEKGANFYELEAYEKNTSGIICVKDRDCGLSFISKAGIRECGVSRSGVICATMLRSFGRFMFESYRSAEKAQILGKHTYYYALSTETDFARLNDIKKSMFEIYPNVRAEDKNPAGFLELSGSVNTSIVKPSENGNGLIVRLYNTKNEPEECVLDFKRPVKNVCAANLAETEFEALHAENNKLELELAPNKIKTIYFEI